MLSSQRAFYGGEVHLRDLATGLLRCGHRVSCLVRPDSALAEQLPALGVEVHGVPLGHWFEPAATLRVRRMLAGLAPDILHTHNPRDYYLGSWASRGLPVCNVATRHQLRRIALVGLKRPLLDRFAAVIAVSEAVRDGLIASGLPPGRIVTVPNGVALPDADEVEPETLRRDLGLATAAGPYVGFVGRLCPGKGLDVLLWAASLIRGRWPQLAVLIIGGDPRQGAYQRQLSELAQRLGVHAHFLGYRPDAARMIRSCDVLAVPSAAEPFGLVTLEALARGVPVVASRSGGSREIIRDGEDGLLVAPGDPEALAASIHRLLVDCELYAACAESGPRRVAESFSLGQQINGTERVYTLAVAGAPMPRSTVALRARRARA